MKKFLSLLIVFCIMTNVTVVLAQNNAKNDSKKTVIYVSPDGNDLNPGTSDKPLRTLVAARDKVREIKKKRNPIEVIFHAGEYPITETVSFNDLDTGNEYAPITYKAAGDGEVLFTAGIEIDVSLFEPVTDKSVLSRLPKSSVGRVGQLDLTTTGASIDHFKAYGRNRGMYLNTRKQKVAKWPNSNFEYIKEVAGSSVFKYDCENANNWISASDMYIEGYPAYEYTGGAYRCEIEPIDRSIKLINATVKRNHRWRAINLIEEMDIPGEFYVDSEKRILYYYPEKLLNPDEDRLIFNRWAFTMVSVKNCDYINFDGLSFGFADGTCIDMSNCHNVQVENCTFKCAGTGMVADFASNFLVDSNTVYEMNDVGISVYQTKRNTPTEVKYLTKDVELSNIVIKNNYLSNCMLDYIGSTGCINFGGVGVVVEHNIISGCVNSAIMGAGPDSIVQYNDIYNAVRETADAGAYYNGRSWTLFGNTLQYNYIHDLGDKDFAAENLIDCIFWDDTGSGQRALFNILRPNSKQKTYGVISGGGSDNVIEGNIIISSDEAIGVQDRTSGTATIDTFASGGPYKDLKAHIDFNSWIVSKYPEMKRIFNQTHFRPDYNTIKNNVIVESKEPNIAEYVKNSPTTVNEGNYVGNDYSIFVNPEKQDFRVKKSAKEALGLDDSILDEDFDISLIGIQRDMPNIDRSFYKTYPKNGDKGFDPQKVTLAWQRSHLADEYYYEVATDIDFKNVVQSGTTIYNNVMLESLDEDTTYYWRVTAKNISLKFQSDVVASGEPYLFKTSKHIVKIDYSTLIARINNAKRLLVKINEGKNLGDHKAGTKEELRKAIEIAELVANDKRAEQTEIYNADEVLLQAITKAKYSVHVGFIGTVDTNPNAWESLTNVDINKNGDEVNFTRTESNGTATTKENVPGYGIYTFMAKEADPGGWYAIALHHTVKNSALIYDGGGLSTCFMLVKPNQVEIQAWNQTGKRQLRITVPNDGFYSYNEWTRIEFGVLPMRMGMLVYVKMNDRQVCEYLDEVNPTLEEGMMCISPSKSLSIKAVDDALDGVIYNPPPEVMEVDENIYYYDTDSTVFASSGNWTNVDAIKGYGDKSVKIADKKDASTLFDISLSGEPDYYNVSFYLPEIENPDKKTGIEMKNLYTSYKTEIDLSAHDPGWIDLGTFNFIDESAKASMLIKLTASGEGVLPVNVIRITKASEKESEFLKLFVNNVKNGMILGVDNPDAYVNGIKYTLDSSPVIINSRTLVPLRFISEAFDCDVVWDENNNTAHIECRDKKISFTKNSSTYTVDGEKKELDQPAEIINDRFMVPIRVISEEINKQVLWDEASGGIIIADEINISQEQREKISETLLTAFNLTK